MQDCRDVFSTQEKLKLHEKRHKMPGGFLCIKCEKHFINEMDCYQHMESSHDIYRCLLCSGDDFLNGIEQFNEHSKNEHNGRNGKYSVCFDCGAHFEQRTYLR